MRRLPELVRIHSCHPRSTIVSLALLLGILRHHQGRCTLPSAAHLCDMPLSKGKVDAISRAYSSARASNLPSVPPTSAGRTPVCVCRFFMGLQALLYLPVDEAWSIFSETVLYLGRYSDYPTVQTSVPGFAAFMGGKNVTNIYYMRPEHNCTKPA